MFNLLVFIIGLSVLGFDMAFACSCADETLVEAYHTSSPIFKGRVVSITAVGAALGEDEGTQVAVVFAVDTVYKGQGIQAQTTVITASEESSCGIPFAVGEGYLIYGYRYQDKIISEMCSRTTLLGSEEADEDIAWLTQQPKAIACVHTRTTYRGKKRWVEVKNECPSPITVHAIDVYWSRNIKRKGTGTHEIENVIEPRSGYKKIHTLKRNRVWKKTDYRYNLYWSDQKDGFHTCSHWMQDPKIVEKSCY